MTFDFCNFHFIFSFYSTSLSWFYLQACIDLIRSSAMEGLESRLSPSRPAVGWRYQPSQRMSKSPISLSLFSLHAYIVSFQGPIKPCSGSRVTRLNNTYQLDSRALITLPRDQQKQKKKVRKRENIAIKNNNVLKKLHLDYTRLDGWTVKKN